MDQLSLTEFLSILTVRLQAGPRPNGQWSSCGTGFFYSFEFDGSDHLPAIITNKHVVGDSPIFSLQLHEQRDAPVKGPGRQVVTRPEETLFVPHPDPDVDLGALLVGRLFERLQREEGWTPRGGFINESNLAGDGELRALSALEQVTMLGYPNGLYDAYNNAPVARRGITASPPWNLYQGRQEFLVDLAVFPGSSGSPVFIANEGSYSTPDGTLNIGNRFLVLGVLYAGHQMTNHGEVIAAPAPTTHISHVEMRQMIHLGLCLRASRIVELKAQLGAILRRRAN